MEALGIPQLAFFCFVIIVSYAIRGSAGFGGVTVPLLAWVMSLKTVVPMVTFLGILSSVAILRTEYKYIVWKDLWRIMPWCVLGVAAGLYFFKVLDSRTLAQALGVVVMAYGAGSRIHDVDGNAYIDYVGSWGPLILGHADPAVVGVVQKAAARGLSFGATTELEVELARLRGPGKTSIR